MRQNYMERDVIVNLPYDIITTIIVFVVTGKEVW